jgi:hypothetical protein
LLIKIREVGGKRRRERGDVSKIEHNIAENM